MIINDDSLYLYKLQYFDIPSLVPPFHPDTAFKEYPFIAIGPTNLMYQSVRDMFINQCFDHQHTNSSQWNPLGSVIKENQTVLIKPNLVFHENKNPKASYSSVVTEPGLIRAIIDYVFIALAGKGRIIIADASLNNCDFEKVCENIGLLRIIEFYQQHNFSIELIDLRNYTMQKNAWGIIRNRCSRQDKLQCIDICMDAQSAFEQETHPYMNFRVTEFNADTMHFAHQNNKHRYSFASVVLNADVIINMPKIKTHRKTGFSCALKNFIGINSNKDYLPHYTKYSVSEGGDEYCNKSFRKKLISDIRDMRWSRFSAPYQFFLLLCEQVLLRSATLIPFHDPYLEGSWYGNRTLPKTILDINRAILYADIHGTIQQHQQRNILHVIDGIVCGEGDGPLATNDKQCNLILMGSNAFSVDCAVCTLMGFDILKIPLLCHCLHDTSLPPLKTSLEKILIHSNTSDSPFTLQTLRTIHDFNFIPPQGWKEHCEL